MTTQLETLGQAYTRIDAINGRELEFPIAGFSELGYRLLHGRRTNPGAVGCYLSHMKAIDEFLRSDHTHALVLEDDAELPQDLPEIMKESVRRVGQWDVLRLSTVSRGRKHPVAQITETRSLAVALTREKGAAAYVLNRRAAEVFRQRLMPVRLSWDIAFAIGNLFGLKALFVVPVPVNQRTGFESGTDDHLGYKWRLPAWRHFTVFPYRAYLESNRIMRRAGLYLFLRWRNRTGGFAA